MEYKIKDCPHCGFQVSTGFTGNMYVIYCQNCDTKKVSVNGDVLVKKWNRRYDRDKLVILKTLLELNPDYTSWAEKNFATELKLIEEENI